MNILIFYKQRVFRIFSPINYQNLIGIVFFYSIITFLLSCGTENGDPSESKIKNKGQKFHELISITNIKDSTLVKKLNKIYAERNDTIIEISEIMEFSDTLNFENTPIKVKKYLKYKEINDSLFVTFISEKELDPDKYLLFNRYSWSGVDTFIIGTIPKLTGNLIKQEEKKFLLPNSKFEMVYIISKLWDAYLLEQKGNCLEAINIYKKIIDTLDSINIESKIKKIYMYNVSFRCGYQYYELLNKPDVNFKLGNKYEESANYYFRLAAKSDTIQPKPYVYMARILYDKINWEFFHFLVQSSRKDELTNKGQDTLMQAFNLVNQVIKYIDKVKNLLDHNGELKEYYKDDYSIEKRVIKGLYSDISEKISANQLNIRYLEKKYPTKTQTEEVK